MSRVAAVLLALAFGGALSFAQDAAAVSGVVFRTGSSGPRELLEPEPAVFTMELQRMGAPLSAHDIVHKHLAKHRRNATQAARSTLVTDSAASTRLLNTMVTLGQYVGTLLVGTPPRRHNVVFDTGSSDTWVRGLTRSASTTFKALNRGGDITYGAGSRTITIPLNAITETVAVPLGIAAGMGGATSLRIKRYTMATTKAKNSFTRVGIVGMAWPALARFGQPPLPVALADAGVASKSFGVWINATGPDSVAEGARSLGGVVTFGGADARFYRGRFAWVPLVKLFLATRPAPAHAWWASALTAASIGSTRVRTPGSVGVFDTGTQVIFGTTGTLKKLLPTRDFARVDIRSLPGTTLFLVPAARYAKLQPVVFEFGGVKLKLDPRHYVIQNNANWYPFGNNIDEKKIGGKTVVIYKGRPHFWTVFFGLAAGAAPPQFDWLFGVPLFQQYYAVFNYTSASVGFAEARVYPARVQRDVAPSA